MAKYPDDDDGIVLTQLEEEGIDMTRPLLLEFTVAAPDERSANAIEKAVTKLGYEAQIEFDEGELEEGDDLDESMEEFGPAWTVFLKVSMVPTYDEIIRIQEMLDEIAGPHGGESDGWGVMLEPDEDEE